jgi:hypothetical protein
MNTASIIHLSACHESALPAHFLRTTWNIQNVYTSYFFTPWVSCVSVQSKVKRNQVAVQCYLFVSAFSVCFSIEVFLYNYFWIFHLYDKKHLPVSGFYSTYVAIQNISSIFFQWIAGCSPDPKKTVKTSVTVPLIAVEVSTIGISKYYARCHGFICFFIIRSYVHWTY